MDLNESVGNRDRFVRKLLAVFLAVVAISSLRKGKRSIGVLAGAGAVALGYDAATESGEPKVPFGVDEIAEDGDETAEGGSLRCAICGEPIRPGQRRGPDANDDIVHDACEASPE